MKHLFLALAVLTLAGCSSAKPRPETTEDIFNAGYKASWTNLREGRTLFQRGLDLARQQGDQVKIALFLVNLGGLAGSLGDYPKSLDYYAQALKLQRTLPAHEEVEARILKAYGVTYEELGDFAKALEYYSAAVALTRKINEKWDEATFLGDLGRIYTKLGDSGRALECHVKALEVSRSLHDKEREGTAQDNLGLVYLELGENAKALAAFDTALKLSRENKGYPSSLGIELHRSDVFLAEGRQDEAQEIFIRVNDAERLGRFFLLSDRLGEAEDMFHKVIRAGKQTRRRGLSIAGKLGLGLTLERRGDTERARAAYDEAIAEIELERDLLPLSARGAFLSGNEYGFLPRLAAYQGRARVSEDAATAFFWAENTKARVFVESLSQKLRKSASGLPEELARRESQLNVRLLSLTKEMELAFGRDQMSRYQELAPELESAKKDQAALIEELRGLFPKYAALLYPQPIKAESVALKPTEVLLEFEVTATKTLLFVVRTGQPVARIDISIAREALEDLVRRFRKPFENPVDDNGRFLGGFDSEAGTALYDQLFKPAVDRGLLAKGAEIVIVPDGMLGLLPFEALKVGSGSHYLGDDYDVAYSQSATALTQARTLSPGTSPGKGAFVLADPIFDVSDPRASPSPRRHSEPVLVQAQIAEAVAQRMGADEDSGFVRLSDTGHLARAMARIFGQDAAALVGAKATKAELLKTKLSRFRFLVFATHGILDQDVPYIREPALVLTQINRKGEAVDGFLRMSEVMDFTLNADLVALTACKTGLGRTVGGEGVVGLGRAFQYAGAKNVLVSLWSVAEKSTTLFAQAVLERLKSGDSPRQALRKARLQVRARGYDHPFFWAPFILVGG